jgi:hypothetical protein
MKFRTMASISAPLIFINATLFLIAPTTSLAILGRTTDLTGIMNTRISGACALGLSVIIWLSRNVHYPEIQRIITFGILTSLSLLVFIDIQGIVTGAINHLGWLIFVADFFLLIGFVSSIFTGTNRKT